MSICICLKPLQYRRAMRLIYSFQFKSCKEKHLQTLKQEYVLSQRRSGNSILCDLWHLSHNKQANKQPTNQSIKHTMWWSMYRRLFPSPFICLKWQATHNKLLIFMRSLSLNMEKYKNQITHSIGKKNKKIV
jgi:hypothetical protein